MPVSPVPVGPRACVVTGAAGFVGSHLVDRLLADGHAVLGLDCFTDYYPRAVKERNLSGAQVHPNFRFAEVDLREAALAPLVAGADAVFHLAAMGGLRRSWTWFDAYMTCNVQATQRLLEAVRETGVPLLVHVSTSSVYGRDSTGDETRTPRPVSPYGVTKLAAEHLVNAYGQGFGLGYTILRYFSIYGPRQRPDMGYHVFIDHILRGEPITVDGDGSNTRGNTYVDDCVAATVAALERGPTGEVFNVGGGEVVSALEALALIERITGRAAIVEFGPPRPGDQRQALADTTKIRERFGWAPRVRLADGLAAQVAWQEAELAAGVTA